jgi:hypothetical protein
MFGTANWWAGGVFQALSAVKAPGLQDWEWLWEMRHLADAKDQLRTVLGAGLDPRATSLCVEGWWDRSRVAWAAYLTEQGFVVSVSVASVSEFLRQYMAFHDDAGLLRWAFAHGLSCPPTLLSAPLEECLKPWGRWLPLRRAELAAVLIENGASGLHTQGQLDEFRQLAAWFPGILGSVAGRVRLIGPN